MFDLQRSQIQALSATVLAAAASLLAVYVEPYIQSASSAEKALYALFSIPALYGCFLLSESALRRFYYRRVLGAWYYVTISNSQFKDENFARMRFHFNKDGMLCYEVTLYPDADAMVAAVNSRGRAYSTALNYDPDKKAVHVLYNVKLNSGSFRRYGRLRLELQELDTLQGDWSSVVDKGTGPEVSSGVMFAARPKEFFDKYALWSQEESGRNE